MAKASATIDIGALKVAGETNKYVTFIDSTNGIRVHKAGETNSNFAQINSYGLQVYKGGQTDSYKIAEFGETSYIGKHDGSQSYMRLDSNALQMIDKEGHLYFEVKDLRENGEFATVSESFPILASENNPSLPDIDTYYVLKGSVAATSNVIGVKINGTSVSNWQASVQSTGMCIKFTSTSGLTVGDIATVSYQTSGSNLKALTFGSRGSSNLHYPGGYSVAMGDEVIAEGDYSFASGYHTKAYGIYSAAMGMETIAGKAGQVAIGEYNERDNDALFVIGNGIADDNRSNLMVVGNKSIRIGNLSTSHLLMDYHSLQMIDKESNSYFDIRDLRDTNGNTTFIRNITTNGTTGAWSYPEFSNSTIVVQLDGVTLTPNTDYWLEGGSVVFSSPPAANKTLTITLTTNSDETKAFTFGLRSQNANHYIGPYSIAKGINIAAMGKVAESTGKDTEAWGNYSTARGLGTIASATAEVTIGRYNQIVYGGAGGAFIIGNGTSDDNRSNALTVDWNGNIIAQGMAGQVVMFAGSTAPAGWLICNGTAVSRTTYATLFAIIGITYGAGDGSTTFNLPNLQGRVAIGVSSSHTLASTGGAETVTLTAAQSGVPAHSHTATGSEYFVCNDLATANNANVDLHSSGTARRADALNSTANVWHHNRSTANNTAANASAAHNNMQPFITMNYIICTGKTN